MDVKLVVVGGDAKPTEIKLKLPTIIGRGRGSSLMLRHPLVSRQHCEIFEVEGQLRVRDMGSLNGTFVGNKAISEAALPPGELLTVGTVTFRAVYGNAPDLSPNHTPDPKKKEEGKSDKTLPDPADGTMRVDDDEQEVDFSADFAEIEDKPTEPKGESFSEDDFDIPDADEISEAEDVGEGEDVDEGEEDDEELEFDIEEALDEAEAEEEQAKQEPGAKDDEDLSSFLKNLE